MKSNFLYLEGYKCAREMPYPFESISIYVFLQKPLNDSEKKTISKTIDEDLAFLNDVDGEGYAISFWQPCCGLTSKECLDVVELSFIKTVRLISVLKELKIT